MLLNRSPRLSVILFLVSALIFPGIAAAFQEDSDSGVEPDVLVAFYPKDSSDGSRFEAEVTPGESVEMTALIVNYDDEPVEIRKYTSNVIPRINGGLQVESFDSTPTGQTLWIDFPTEEFTIQGGETIERTMTISVPEGTPPGEYVNAVSIATVNPSNSEQAGAFQVYYGKVVSVYITVPGEIQADFEIGQPELIIDGARAAIQFPVINSGNVRVDLVGHVTVNDSNGNPILDADFFMSPVYNGQTTGLQLRLGSVPEAGEYQVSYTFSDSNHEVSKSSDDVALTAPERDDSVDAPLRFENVLIEPNADPIVFANVSVDVTSLQQSFRSTRLTMSVFRDGELVEDFVLADNLSVSRGTSTVTQRYLPLTDWESGVYTFSLRLESVDGNQTSVVLEEQDVATLEVP